MTLYERIKLALQGLDPIINCLPSITYHEYRPGRSVTVGSREPVSPNLLGVQDVLGGYARWAEDLFFRETPLMRYVRERVGERQVNFNGGSELRSPVLRRTSS